MDSATKNAADDQPMATTTTNHPPSSSSESEWDEFENPSVPVVMESPPPAWWTGRSSTSSTSSTSRNKKRLSKQMSMRETTREAAWERRRRQALRRMSNMGVMEEEEEDEAAASAEEEVKNMRRVKSLTDEDLAELRGSIELGFGFNEDDGGHGLCDTLPALGLYFAVNRQFSDPKMQTPSPVSTPTTAGGASSPSLVDSPRSPSQASGSSDSWKLLHPGDTPQHVKTRLRHWAQAVACSVRQCC